MYYLIDYNSKIKIVESCKMPQNITIFGIAKNPIQLVFELLRIKYADASKKVVKNKRIRKKEIVHDIIF